VTATDELVTTAYLEVTMIEIRSMTEAKFEEFKKHSQSSFAGDFAKAQGASVDEALKNASEQFDRLVSSGLQTEGQLFFDVVEQSSGKSVGYLWLGTRQSLGRKIISINDIFINPEMRGRGYGKLLMNLVDTEAKKAKAVQIRLHVFASNKVARGLYETSGYESSSLDMFKIVT
jgi:ribosomal protein S18 acetylase RimI-like enzyme